LLYVFFLKFDVPSYYRKCMV